MRAANRKSGGKNTEQVSNLLVNCLRIGYGLGDLLAQDLAEPLSHPVDPHFDCPFTHSQFLPHIAIAYARILPGEESFQPIELLPGTFLNFFSKSEQSG